MSVFCPFALPAGCRRLHVDVLVLVWDKVCFDFFADCSLKISVTDFFSRSPVIKGGTNFLFGFFTTAVVMVLSLKKSDDVDSLVATLTGCSVGFAVEISGVSLSSWSVF